MTEILLPKAITYGQLQKTLRARWLHLQTPLAVLDEVTGLPSGYSSKLLALEPCKTLGRLSLPLMLEGLCLRLIVVDDRAYLRGRRSANLFCVQVKDYREFQAALQRRQQQLKVPWEKLDEAIGKHSKKILSPIPSETLNPEFIEPLLSALRLKLLPCEDYAAFANLSGRLVPRRNNFTAFGRKHWRYRRARKARAACFDGVSLGGL